MDIGRWGVGDIDVNSILRNYDRGLKNITAQ